MTPHLDERRPPGGGREAAASQEKQSKVNKQNTIAALLRQVGANRGDVREFVSGAGGGTPRS
jgi:hypothetical protein